MTTPPQDGRARFRGSIDELEQSTHVPAEEQVVEIPGSPPGRGPGEGDLAREQRDALRAGG